MFTTVYEGDLSQNASSNEQVRVETNSLVVKGKYDRKFFSQDGIQCEGTLGNLHLKRYGKSDFKELYIRNPWPDDYTTQLITGDYRTVKDGIQEVINLFH